MYGAEIMKALAKSVWTLTVISLIWTPILLSRAALAGTIDVVNSGFEDPPLADGGEGAVAGWVEGYTEPSGDAFFNVYEGGDAGGVNPDAAYGYGGAAKEGSNVGFGYSYTGFDVGLRQLLPALLAANMQYDLTVWVGNPYAINGDGPASNYRVQLVADGVIIAESSGSPPADDSTWKEVTLSLVTGPAHPQMGEAIEIRLLAADAIDGAYVNFDDLSLSSTHMPVSITILNPGFEEPILADGAQDDAVSWVEGYTEPSGDYFFLIEDYNDARSLNPDAAYGYGGSAPEGTNVAFALSYTGYDVGLSQILSATVGANRRYDLSVMVGNPYPRNAAGAASDYRLQLLSDGVLLAEDNSPSPALSNTWLTASLVYESGSAPTQLGSPLEIRILAGETVDGSHVNFDDVNLTATVVPALIPISIATQAPSEITDDSAILNAALSLVETNARVNVYWGHVDGTNNPMAWAESVYLGEWSDVDSIGLEHLVGSLSPSTTYYCTFQATNDMHDIWGTTRTFMTAPEGCIWVGNPGFERPVLADGEFGIPEFWREGYYNLGDPDLVDYNGGYVGSVNPTNTYGYGGVPLEGENAGFVIVDAGYDDVLRQILPTPLMPGTVYTLAAWVGNPSAHNGGATADYRIELVAGSVLLASPTGPSPLDDTSWTNVVVTYTSPQSSPLMGEPLEIRLVAVDNTDDLHLNFDNVTLKAKYPGYTLILLR